MGAYLFIQAEPAGLYLEIIPRSQLELVCVLGKNKTAFPPKYSRIETYPTMHTFLDWNELSKPSIPTPAQTGKGNVEIIFMRQVSKPKTKRIKWLAQSQKGICRRSPDSQANSHDVLPLFPINKSYFIVLNIIID